MPAPLPELVIVPIWLMPVMPPVVVLAPAELGPEPALNVTFPVPVMPPLILIKAPLALALTVKLSFRKIGALISSNPAPR